MRTSEQLGSCSLVQLPAASDQQTYKDPRPASERLLSTALLRSLRKARQVTLAPDCRKW